MAITYVRVVNEQIIERSILIDKIDRSQGNFEGYAQRAKQKVYVPYVNPADTQVKGYIDLIPTDQVLLSVDSGTIKGLQTGSYISFALVSSDDIIPSSISNASHGGGKLTVDGTTFTSLSPDVTAVVLTNTAGGTQTVRSAGFDSFSNTQIKITDGTITIGTPASGWTVTVFANSKNSNTYTI